MASYQDRQEARRAFITAHVLPHNKTAVAAGLAKLGIAGFTAEFNGEGDSGSVDHIAYYDKEGLGKRIDGEEAVELRAAPDRWRDVVLDEAQILQSSVSLKNAVYDLVDQALDLTDLDWYNNDGGYGEVVFDVASLELRVDMNIRVTDSVFSEHAF